MTVPSRVHLFYNSCADEAVLSGGSWDAAMPLSRMQTQSLTDIARSTNLDLASTTFDISLPDLTAVRGIMFGPSNLTPWAQVQIIAMDDDFEEEVEVWPWQQIGNRIPFGTLPYGAPGVYDGIVPWSDKDRDPWSVTIFDGPSGSYNWRVKIDDTDNPDGYIRIGRLYVWDAYVPSLNYAYGNNGLSLTDNSISSKAVGGSKHVLRLPNKRRWQCQLDVLPETEAFSSFWRAINTAGFDQECFIVPDPEDVDSMHARAFPCRLVQPDPIAQSFFRHATAGFAVEEL